MGSQSSQVSRAPLGVNTPTGQLLLALLMTKRGQPDPARLCLDEGKPAQSSASQRQPSVPQGNLLSQP